VNPAAIDTLCFVSQAWPIRCARDMSGVPLAMHSAMLGGVVLWLVFGLLIGSTPLVAANVVTLSLTGSILVMKLRLSRH
jgi:MtN3 and saliva related transmembrane protein